MIIISFCARCKHFGETEKRTCPAFPEGIPPEYVWGDVDVKTLSECANGVKYESADSGVGSVQTKTEVKDIDETMRKMIYGY